LCTVIPVQLLLLHRSPLLTWAGLKGPVAPDFPGSDFSRELTLYGPRSRTLNLFLFGLNLTDICEKPYESMLSETALN
jgi:hypothetical protein